jgi:hypothetical protein
MLMMLCALFLRRRAAAVLQESAGDENAREALCRVSALRWLLLEEELGVCPLRSQWFDGESTSQSGSRLIRWARPAPACPSFPMVGDGLNE